MFYCLHHINNKTHGPDDKLKPKEQKHCHENNLCMICGRSDHRAVTCTAYAKGWASPLRPEGTQTPPDAVEPLQIPELTEAPEEEHTNSELGAQSALHFSVSYGMLQKNR